MKKKLLALLLSGLMIFSAVSVSAAVLTEEEKNAVKEYGINLYPVIPFHDVSINNWFFDCATYVFDEEIMNGTEAGVFAPTENMTRAQFVTTLCRLAKGEEDAKAAAKKFSDVKETSWYAGYVGWATNNGIVDGFPNGTFEPGSNITREQMSKVIALFLEYSKTSLPEVDNPVGAFGDEDQIGGWAKKYVNLMRNTGLINGDNFGNFNPKDNLQRAQAAKVLMGLDLGIKDANAPDYRLWTANKIYHSFCNAEAQKDFTLNESGTYPIAETTAPSVTFDIHCMNLDLDRYPVFELVYTGGADSVTVNFNNSRYTGDGFLAVYDPINVSETLTATADGDYKSVYIDLSKYADEKGGLMRDEEISVKLNISFGSAVDFGILYAGFFKDNDTCLDVDLDDVKNTLLVDISEGLFYKEASKELQEQYETEISDRIDEIVNCTDDIDPSTIKGTCYYISSINGDDNNDGLSPETPWKSITKLYTWKAGGRIMVNNVQPGDAVFFERGSVFQAWTADEDHKAWQDANKTCLMAAGGVTYAAYGEGDKPLFTSTLELDTPAGTWLETEYENIYKLDYHIPVGSAENLVTKQANYNINDVGSIVINDGEMWGIKLIPYSHDDADGPTNPFGEDVLLKYLGVNYNGRDFFNTCGLPLDYDGEFHRAGSTGLYSKDAITFTGINALQNNLEYYHHLGTGELFMYCSDGNPGEVYDKITISTKAIGIMAGSTEDGSTPTVFDNLAVKHVGGHGLSGGNWYNIHFSNLELGWIGGSFQGQTTRYGNAIENWGHCDGYTVKNCYVYQVYDSGVGTQYMGDRKADLLGPHMKNVEFSNNVFTHITMAVEIWNYATTTGLANGYITQRGVIENIDISNNFFAYCGYGFGSQRPYEYRLASKSGSGYGSGNGFSFTKMRNWVMEDNVVYKCANGVYGNANYYREENSDSYGTTFRNNVYVLSNKVDFVETSRNLTRHPCEDRYKIPYNVRGLAYLTSFGIEKGSEFYYIDGYVMPGEEYGAFH